MNRAQRFILLILLTLVTTGMLAACGTDLSSSRNHAGGTPAEGPNARMNNDSTTHGKIIKSDDEWRAELTEEQYAVLRGKGTEMPYTGAYYRTTDDGSYYCAACGAELFHSDSKFDAGCGWPSFSTPFNDAAIEENRDTSHGMIRTEVTCARCGSHLGHVFNDGPAPTGLRYCINSVSLDFKPKEK